MALKEININQVVRVKLTKFGIEVLRRTHEAFALNSGLANYPDWEPPAVDEDGYSSFQLWVLMREFGPHMTMGSELPFETGMRIMEEFIRDVD